MFDGKEQPSDFMPLLLERLREASYESKSPLFQKYFEDLYYEEALVKQFGGNPDKPKEKGKKAVEFGGAAAGGATPGQGKKLETQPSQPLESGPDMEDSNEVVGPGRGPPVLKQDQTPPKRGGRPEEASQPKGTKGTTKTFRAPKNPALAEPAPKGGVRRSIQ